MLKLIKYAIIFALVLVAALYLIFFLKNSPKDNPKEIYVIVPKGASVASVSDSLAKYDLIRSKLTFKIASRILGTGSRLQPGSYRIAYGLTNTEIVSRLVGSEFAILFEATFPEGSHIRRIASIAKEKLAMKTTRKPLTAANREQTVRALCGMGLLLALPVLAHAQGSPFDSGLTAIQTLFTGTVAKVASLVAIVMGGYGFAHGDPGAKKNLAGVAAGTGIAVLAVNVLTWLWGV